MILCRFWRKKSLAAAAVMAAVVSFAVEPVRLSDLLPRHSAIAAGADFAALCSHPQSAAAFSVLAATAEQYQISLQKLLYSSDGLCRKSSSILAFASAGDVEKLRTLSGIDPATPREISDGIEVYCLNGSPGDRSVVRAARLDREVIGLYADYPRNEKFVLDCSGMDEKLARHIPGRAVLFWSAGYPEFRKEPLNSLRFFESALDNDIDGNLLFHGRVICRSSRDAAMAEMFFPLALSVVMKKLFDIPPWKTLKAIAGMKVTRQENVLTFFCTDLNAALDVVAGIIADQLELPGKAAK